jgi:hypothetical protein
VTPKTVALHEAHDADLEYGAPAGDHDDLVLAAGYAQRGHKRGP